MLKNCLTFILMWILNLFINLNKNVGLTFCNENVHG